MIETKRSGRVVRDCRWNAVLRRAVLAGGMVLGMGLLTGCPPVERDGGKVELFVPGVAAPGLSGRPAAGRFYLPLETQVPLTGAALAKARTSYGEILKEANRVAATMAVAPSAGATTRADATASSPPPPMAIKYYLRGREKFVRQAYSEAIEDLEQALKLDPQAFSVLRLMGRACFASNQLARGSIYLQRAWNLQPADVDVNYLLGRYWMERGQVLTAISFFGRAQASPERNEEAPVAPINMYYLARSLQMGGYALAAAQEYEAFLDLIARPTTSYRYDPELSELIEQRWLVNLAGAENYTAVGGDELMAAAEYYRAALELEPGNTYVTGRLIDVLVRLKQDDEATQLALELARTMKGAEPAIKLLVWTYGQCGRQARLVTDLQTLATTQQPTARLALARLLQEQGQAAEAFNMLLEYQRDFPRDLTMLGSLMEMAKAQQQIPVGFMVLVRTYHAQPEQLPAVRGALARLVGEKPALSTLEMLDKVTPPSAAPPMEMEAQRQMLLAIMYAAADLDDQALRHYELASQADPHFWPARQGYIRQLLTQEKYAKANQLMQESINSHLYGDKVWPLYVETEVVQDRYSSALKIARQARDDYPDNLDLRLLLANVYLLRGQVTEARNTLNSALERFPKETPVYRKLVEIALLEPQRDGRSAIAVVTKLLQVNPDDRFGRLLLAQFMAEERNLDAAAQVLEKLLQEQPDDAEALGLLADVRLLQSRSEDGLKLLQEAWRKAPMNLQMVQLVAKYYGKMDRADDAVIFTREQMLAHRESEDLALVYAATLRQHGRMNDAEACYKEMWEHFPKSQRVLQAYDDFLMAQKRWNEAIALLESASAQGPISMEMWHRLGTLYQFVGNIPKSEQNLQRALALMPDSIGVNNDLGYFWAERGEHLAEADVMISKAVDNQPNNGAFIDSLGWVRYQQGRYAEAVTLLEKAATTSEGRGQPDVIAHLADALWRTGKKTDALSRWRQAAALLEGDPTATSPSEKKLSKYLVHVLTQVEAKATPSVTPSAADKKPSSTQPE